MRWLADRPPQYLGRISYGLDLWHVLLAVRRSRHPAIALAALTANLSYRYPERPVLKTKSAHSAGSNPPPRDRAGEIVDPPP